jgi:mRNA interferase HigB
MRVISIGLLRDFWEKRADTNGPLKTWYKTAKKTEWNSLHEVRMTYSAADGVLNRLGETLTEFDIGGNQYRLVTRIRYDWKLINIRFVLTHREYDKGKGKE